MKNYLQRMGRSLMLPVAALPVAALFTGIGYWIGATAWGADSFIATFLYEAGQAILRNLGILFAVGLAFGMSKDKNGAAALAGLISFLVPITLLKTETIAKLQGIDVTAVNPAFKAIGNGNVFIGILAGLIAAAMYNRFSDVKLPMALAFFSGKRCVPIVTAALMAAISACLILIWPAIYGALVSFGEAISGLGPVGAGLFGFFNRLLIPTGLHHALNNVFWFDLAGINDIGKFWSNEGIKGVTGMYQAGFFPVMMFGLPAGAFAMYRCARPEKKKVTASLMLSAAFASFFTGVTEPLEFAFMFVAWPLYVVHAVLTGLSLFVSAFFHWTAGFNFSAGLIDYVLSLKVPIANQPYMLLVQGVVFAFIYYFVFTFVIKKFNLMTPGREKGGDEVTPDMDNAAPLKSGDRFQVMATKLWNAIGGAANVVTIDNCTTRLRLTLRDTSKIDQNAIKAAGVPGLKVIDKKDLQIIVGTEVQFVADAMAKIQQNALKEQNNKPMDDIFAVANGTLIPMDKVRDDAFSQKLLGDGFAILPQDGNIYAPVAGLVGNIFATKHAIGLTTDSGIEILVHVGIDTVELKGEPFDIKVKEGQRVSQGDLLLTVDLKKLEEHNKKNDIIVAFTNGDAIESIQIEYADYVKANEKIGVVVAKS